MTPESLQKIATEFEKTGFPAEFKVRQVIQRRPRIQGRRPVRWDCTATMGFFDLDEEKFRQVDIYAYLAANQPTPMGIDALAVWALVIEVKKSKNPWVVLAEARDAVRDQFRCQHDLVSHGNLPADWDEEFSWRVYDRSFCKSLGWVGFGVQEAGKKPQEECRTHGALISVVKAAEHFHRAASSTIENNAGRDEGASSVHPSVHFVRPVIVLDGELLAADLGKEGKLELSEIDMAPVYVGYKSSEYDRENYRVDVVRLTALDHYLECAEEQLRTICQTIADLSPPPFEDVTFDCGSLVDLSEES